VRQTILPVRITRTKPDSRANRAQGFFVASHQNAIAMHNKNAHL